ncbi:MULTISPECIES: glutamate-5-semialdehyde dehydrogenase [Roseobacteraceae]|jgi:glutamate-5-semialdehyde dehydrogenase|uniref:Gamma-glutamyl phosphate reductase n=1 Tax=Pseudosulfitobacter pseudonitzschiae TaxID=1402135 RepID=A0A221JZ49_9RHOB|nr:MULTISPECIES: glutamate-5-semialdehyde dehydrogenase [Roseobacteraceae]ASM72012.1 gamma-glutamyl phosphate reductase [Pseudosulfitobacter pseudonitzschiae]
MNTTTLERTEDGIDEVVAGLGHRAKAASLGLALASGKQRNLALTKAAEALRAHTDDLLRANAQDLDAIKDSGKDAAFVDRLTLNAERVAGMADALDAIAAQDDPLGRTLASFDRPNGLRIERISVPIGVIAMIYESRPNVGSDAGALCIKSGNAVILRGGSESLQSSRVIVACMAQGLRAAGLPEDAVQLVDTRDREAVKLLLHSTETVDLVIPRGGRGLVSLVQNEARVPTLLHLDGNNHTYIHASADIEKAVGIVQNAKMRRTGICGATESVVVDAAIAEKALPLLAEALSDCELRGDAAACKIVPDMIAANDEDWDTEYLSNIMSVRIVDGLDAGIAFVQAHSSGHTDAIVAEDMTAARQFMTAVDSAVVMHNASTQFSDGGEFGMGAEIGIATGKMHARGPVGAEQLTSFKYFVHGDGQKRP